MGLADQLSAPPDNASATITSNKTLVMATCATNGVLLQPSYPATPVDDVLIDSHTPLDLYATYTAVAVDIDTPASTAAFWFTTIGWVGGKKGGTSNFTLTPQHLAAMVDTSLPAPSSNPAVFEDPLARVPQETFLHAGHLSNTSGGYIWYRSDFTLDAEAAAGRVKVGAFGEQGAVLPLPTQNVNPRAGDPPAPLYQANIAPVWAVGGDCVAVLGEAGKVTAVSAYRFASVSAASKSTSKLDVVLRGGPGEKVSLLFAESPKCQDDWVTKVITATVGNDGTVHATY